MTGERNLDLLIKGMTPKLNPGQYVFCSVPNTAGINREHILAEFKETEGTTLVLSQQKAHDYGLPYDYVAAWITLEVHSALEAVGLTAAFASALAQNGISCNVMAGYFHDHIFVAYDHKAKAMETLEALAAS